MMYTIGPRPAVYSLAFKRIFCILYSHSFSTCYKLFGHCFGKRISVLYRYIIIMCAYNYNLSYYYT